MISSGGRSRSTELGPVGDSVEYRVPPVVVFAFNRPKPLQSLMDVLRVVQPRVLLVYADGPRRGNDEDVERVAEVRRILQEVDWECEVSLDLRDLNHGCQRSIEMGLDDAFSRVPEAVVLEDDCIPDPSFFRFCSEMLDRYRYERRVGMIAGYRFETPLAYFRGESYAFSGVVPAWGWATWGDRWQAHRRRLPRPWDPPTTVVASTDAIGTSVVSGGMHAILGDAVRAADASRDAPWDRQLAASCYEFGWLSIVPATRMIGYVGFSEGATHHKRRVDLPPPDTMPFPLRHPASVRLSRRVAQQMEYEAMWVPLRGPRTRAAGAGGAARRAMQRLLSSRVVIRTLYGAAAGLGGQAYRRERRALRRRAAARLA